MNLDAAVVGQLLQDVPLGRMIENLGLAIATSSRRSWAVAMASPRLDHPSQRNVLQQLPGQGSRSAPRLHSRCRYVH